MSDERDKAIQWMSLVANPAWAETVELEAALGFERCVRIALDTAQAIEARNAASAEAKVWEKILSWRREWTEAHRELSELDQAEKLEDTPSEEGKQWYDHREEPVG